MIFGKHLILQELTLPPSTEQIPPFDGWLVARVAEGVGYWLQHDRPACQLATGDVFVATRVADGRLRASQLEALKLQFFTVQPLHLEGLLTVVEWHHMEIARRQPPAPVRFFKSTDSVGQKFARLAALKHTGKLPLRCALLQLWAAAAADLPAPEEIAVQDGNKPRARFLELLSRMTRVELCFTSPVELARQINCSERHFRGLFRKEFGLSVHHYLAALRLNYERQSPCEDTRKTTPKPSGSRRKTRRFSLPETRTDSSRSPEDHARTNDSAAQSANHDRGGSRKMIAAERG